MRCCATRDVASTLAKYESHTDAVDAGHAASPHDVPAQPQTTKKDMENTKVEDERAHRMRLLGTGSSSKSTIFKQMRKIFKDGIEESAYRDAAPITAMINSLQLNENYKMDTDERVREHIQCVVGNHCVDGIENVLKARVRTTALVEEREAIKGERFQVYDANSSKERTLRAQEMDTHLQGSDGRAVRSHVEILQLRRGRATRRRPNTAPKCKLKESEALCMLIIKKDGRGMALRGVSVVRSSFCY